MTNKLWCQMCGHEQEATRDACVYDICGACGARILRSPKDGVLEEVLLAKLAKRDALIERLIDAGNWLALHYEVARTKLSINHLSLRIRNWRELIAECKAQK